MGVNYNTAKYMKYCKDIGVSFDRFLMLGHQEFYLIDKGKKRLEKDIPEYRLALKEKYSDEMFRVLGAKTIDVIDISDYEGANIIHDMNVPIPDEYKNRYSCIFDGGATEHIFNFPIAMNNIMKMIGEGGYYIGIIPSDHANGHGFYQFGPMLYIQLFCQKNGFELIELGFCDDTEDDAYWRLKDITKFKRIEINSNKAMMIYVLARKISEFNEVNAIYEGYYENMWKEIPEKAVRKYRNIPNFIKDPVYKLKRMKNQIKVKRRSKKARKILCDRIILDDCLKKGILK